MFCPQCGSTQDDELKYCKTCGANLQALRRVMATRDEEGDFNSNRVQGITPEMKRRREIKAGTITASAGIGLMIILFVLMNGIVAGGRVSDAAAEILMRLWIVGVIPVLVGGALIFNGMFVSKRRELPAGEIDPATNELGAPREATFLGAADTNDLTTDAQFSVTDRTTQHLPRKLRDRDS